MVIERLDSATGPDARLFTGPRGGRISTAVLRDATHWDQVVTELGYEHLRRHDLRHTGLTWLADAGVHVLRRIAGHGSLTTTQRYLHPDQHAIEQAGTALSAHLSSPQSTIKGRLKPSDLATAVRMATDKALILIRGLCHGCHKGQRQPGSTAR